MTFGLSSLPPFSAAIVAVGENVERQGDHLRNEPHRAPGYSLSLASVGRGSQDESDQDGRDGEKESVHGFTS
jgi:hypothetical protein